jgi:sulfite exporter TauE/SafE
MNSVWLAFVTGITTGSVSCLAVQGGLLASSIASQEDKLTRGRKAMFVASFLVSKLVAYTLLGAGLGLLGSTLIISPNLLGFMQILAGIFMLATAGRLLNLHPIFRYFVIEPPKWALRILRKKSKNENFFAPAILGFLTVLIPCGVTQAMMVLAVSSANPLYGGGIMFAFVLGTSPLFFAAGMAVTELLKRKAFVYAASAAIVFLGFLSINTGQVLRGSVHTFQNYYKVITGDIEVRGAVASVNNEGAQDVTINVEDRGYVASTNTLKAGVPVKLTLTTQEAFGCIRAFSIPSLNISKVLPETGQTVIEFTPKKTGLLSYSCSMGMYTGMFNVVN